MGQKEVGGRMVLQAEGTACAKAQRGEGPPRKWELNIVLWLRGRIWERGASQVKWKIRWLRHSRIGSPSQSVVELGGKGRWLWSGGYCKTHEKILLTSRQCHLIILRRKSKLLTLPAGLVVGTVAQFCENTQTHQTVHLKGWMILKGQWVLLLCAWKLQRSKQTMQNCALYLWTLTKRTWKNI